MFSIQASKTSNAKMNPLKKFNSAMLFTERVEDAFINPNHEALNLSTRSLGALQAFGGMTQITLSAAGGGLSLPTGIGPVIATAYATIGFDNMLTGLQTMWKGEHQPTMLFQGINEVGKRSGLYGSQGAAYIEAALNLGTAAIRPKPFTFAYRSAIRLPKPEIARKEEYLHRSSHNSKIKFELADRVREQLKDPRLGQLAGKLNEKALNNLANSPDAQFLLDSSRNYINIIQNIDDVLLRITVSRDTFKIISVGPIRERNVLNSIENGRFIIIDMEKRLISSGPKIKGL